MRTCWVNGEECGLLSDDALYPAAAFGESAVLLQGGVRLLPDSSGRVILTPGASYTLTYRSRSDGEGGSTQPLAPWSLAATLCVLVSAFLVLRLTPNPASPQEGGLRDTLSVIPSEPYPHLDPNLANTSSTLHFPPQDSMRLAIDIGQPQKEQNMPGAAWRVAPGLSCPCALALEAMKGRKALAPPHQKQVLKSCILKHGMLDGVSRNVTRALVSLLASLGEFDQGDLSWLRSLSRNIGGHPTLLTKGARVARNLKLPILSVSFYEEALTVLAKDHEGLSTKNQDRHGADDQSGAATASSLMSLFEEYILYASLQQPEHTRVVLETLLTSHGRLPIDLRSLLPDPAFLHFSMQAYIHLLCAQVLSESALDRAVALMEAHISALPTNYRTFQNLGVFLLINGRWERAVQPLNRGLRLKLMAWNLVSKPLDQRHGECSSWHLLDWSVKSSDKDPRVAAPYGYDYTIVLREGDAHEGLQAAPRRLGCDGQQSLKPSCQSLYNMAYEDSSLVRVRMQDAWLEAPPGITAVLMINTRCVFHATSKIQGASLGDVEPPRGESILQDPRSQVRLESAIHVHWFPRNYYHFTAEVLPKLLWLMRSKEAQTAPVLLEKTKFVVEYLALIGFPESRVRWTSPPNERLHVDNLDVLEFSSDSSVRFSVAPRSLLVALREALAPPLPLAERNLILYLRRSRDAFQRAVRGDELLIEELEHLCQALNFTLVVMEDSKIPGVKQQIWNAQHARVIIGAHGAGLANTVWVGPGSALVELPIAPLQPSTFSYVARALGVDYWVVPEVSATQMSTYFISPPAIPRVVDTVRRIITGS